MILNERDIEAEIEGENRIVDEQVRIGPKWEKVLIHYKKL